MPSFSTRTAALRSLKDISTEAVMHAKQLITEQDGKFFFDEDAAEQFLNTQDNLANANLENNMTTITLENLKTVTTAELVTFYNDHAESSVKKFRDRATAEKKVQVILEAIEADEANGNMNEDFPDGTDVEEMKVEAATKSAPKMMSLADTEAFAQSLVANKNKNAPKSILGDMLKAATVVTDDFAKVTEAEHKFHRGEKDAPMVKTTSEGRTVSDTQAETMKTTLKLDRTIVCGNEEWKNAFQMWKEHTDWMTSAQQDGLTAKLYKAAKNGEKIEVTINGRTFYLKNV